MATEFDRLPRIVIATRSRHKLRELRELLGPARADYLSLDQAGVPAEIDPVESGATFRANARLKARFFAGLTGLPTLADDSGLEVDALNGGPGVRTRRFAGEQASDAANNAKLLHVLADVSAEGRGARYVCVLALAEAGHGRVGRPRVVAEVRGTCRGRIATTPRGDGGFGYDPIFEPASEPPGGRTFGHWSHEEKNRISHRGRAAIRMARRLKQLGF